MKKYSTPSELSNEKNSENVTAPQVASKAASLTLTELEAMRVGKASIPASKYSLELICGASCEISAQ